MLFRSGGAFDKIALPIKFGVGSPLGSGKQYMPWIHEEDLARLIVEVVKNKSFNGVYNAVAPKHITNSEFINKVAEKMSRPLFLPPVPEFLLKLIFGEMSVVITKGSRVSAEKLLATGFSFRYDSSEKAIDNLLSQ